MRHWQTKIKLHVLMPLFSSLLALSVLGPAGRAQTAGTNQSGAPHAQDSQFSSFPCDKNQTYSPIDKKPCKAQTAPRRNSESARTSATNSGYTLTIGTDLDCSIKVDDSAPRELSTDEPFTIKVSRGEHLLSAISTDGKDRWSKVVDVEKPGKKVVLVNLAAIKQQREETERTRKEQTQAHAREVAAEMERQKEREAELQRAAEEQAAASRAAAQREEKTGKIKELRSRIAELQQEAEEDENEAQEDEKRAQELEQQCAAINGPCVNQTFVYTNRSDARRKKQEARELRSQIAGLQREIDNLSNE